MVRVQDDLRLLLLQIREDPGVQQEEFASFVRYSGLQAAQFDLLNVYDRPVFPAHILDAYHGLFIGGASEASVMEPDRFPFIEESKRLVRYAVERAVPVFASCFGFQLSIDALGGTLVRDQNGYEMGTPAIHVTRAGRRDPLFQDTPSPFRAVSVHQERTPVLPAGLELLAFSDACPHAFKVIGRPFWGFQFHPEVDRAVLIQRLRVYQEKYTDSADHFDAVIESATETPDANRLVKKFVQRVLVSGEAMIEDQRGDP